METYICTADQLRRLNRVCVYFGFEPIEKGFISEEGLNEFLFEYIDWWIVTNNGLLRERRGYVIRELCKSIKRLQNIKTRFDKWEFVETHLRGRIARYRRTIYTDKEIDVLIDIIKNGTHKEIKKFLNGLCNEN